MSLKRNSIWNLAGAGLPLLIGAIAIPYLVQRLGVERFGILSLVWSLIGYFSLFDFGMGRALTQQLAKRIGTPMQDEIPQLAKAGMVCIGATGGVGALFGVLGSRPYWNSGLTPIVFLVGALLSGGALLTFVTALFDPNRGTEEHRDLVLFLGKIVLGLLAFDVLLEWADYSISYYASIPAHVDALRLVLFGPYWWVFWVVHLGFGVIIPAYLLIVGRRSLRNVAAAGFLIAVTFIAVRLNILIPALVTPELGGLEQAFSGPGLTFAYFPSLTEWLLGLWAASLAVLVFLAGLHWLPILTQPKEVA
jgi:molybdopterin-containing oxidoreductase family membrane subunit